MRMRLINRFLQPIHGDMGINLGCGQGTVSEQFLHRTQIRAVIQHVRGKGMAQHMRMQRLIQPGTDPGLF